MNRNTRDHLLDILVWVLLVGCLLFVLAWVSGCSTLKSAGSGAIGAGIGFLVPPFGPVVGAGIGAAIGSMLAVNEALQHVHTYGPPPVHWTLQPQTWVLAAGLYLLLRNREHLVAFLKAGKGARLKTAARGLLHSVVGGKVGKPHTR